MKNVNNDYIERSGVLCRLEDLASVDWQPRAIRRAAKVVGDFPASDVRVPVKGKWVYVEGRGCTCCSVCMASPVPERYIPYNYCPNCGADMRG